MITPENLVKDISSWSVKDVMHAVELLKKEFGISDMVLAPQAAGPAAVSAGVEPATEEKTEFSVFLTGFNKGEGIKLNVMKAIRKILGTDVISLIDAKKIVEDLGNTPYKVRADIAKAEADEIKKQIEDAGGIVEVK